MPPSIPMDNPFFTNDEQVAVEMGIDINARDALSELLTLNRVVQELNQQLLATGEVSKGQVVALQETLDVTRGLSSEERGRLEVESKMLEIVQGGLQQSRNLIAIEHLLKGISESRVASTKEELDLQKQITLSIQERARAVQLLEHAVARGDNFAVMAAQQIIDQQTMVGPAAQLPAEVEDEEGGGVHGPMGMMALTRTLTGVGRQAGGAFQQRAQAALPRGGIAGSALGALRNVAPVAIPVGAGFMAYNAYAQGAQLSQQYGQLTGEDDFGAAVGYEAQARVMALNPLISTGQAREFIMTALREGYGKETGHFDTITEFMADNMKKFGMSAKQSVELYETAIEKANTSVSSVSLALDRVRESATESRASLEDMVTGFVNTFQAAAALGAGPGSSALAEYLTRTTADQRVLAETLNWDQLIAPGSTLMTRVAAEQGLTPDEVFRAFEEGRLTPEIVASGALDLMRRDVTAAFGLPAEPTAEDLAQISPEQISRFLPAMYPGIGITTPAEGDIFLKWLLLGEGFTSPAEVAAEAAPLATEVLEVQEERFTDPRISPVGKRLQDQFASGTPFMSPWKRSKNKLLNEYINFVSEAGLSYPGVEEFLQAITGSGMNVDNWMVYKSGNSTGKFFFEYLDEVGPGEFFREMATGEITFLGERADAEKFFNDQELTDPTDIHHWTGRAAVVEQVANQGGLNNAERLTPRSDILLTEDNRMDVLTGVILGDTEATPEEVEAAIDLLYAEEEQFIGPPPPWEFDEDWEPEGVRRPGGGGGGGGGLQRPRVRGDIRELQISLTPEAERLFNFLEVTGDITSLQRKQSSRRGE